jgi:hypothetical protein
MRRLLHPKSLAGNAALARPASTTGQLRDPGVIGPVNASLERRPRSSGAAVARGEPIPLRRVDRPEARAARLLIKNRHAPVLRRQHRIGADGVLDRGSRIAAVEARAGDRAGCRRPRQPTRRRDFVGHARRRAGDRGSGRARRLGARRSDWRRGFRGGPCLLAAYARSRFRLGDGDRPARLDGLCSWRRRPPSRRWRRFGRGRRGLRRALRGRGRRIDPAPSALGKRHGTGAKEKRGGNRDRERLALKGEHRQASDDSENRERRMEFQRGGRFACR